MHEFRELDLPDRLGDILKASGRRIFSRLSVLTEKMSSYASKIESASRGRRGL